MPVTFPRRSLTLFPRTTIGDMLPSNTQLRTTELEEFMKSKLFATMTVAIFSLAPLLVTNHLSAQEPPPPPPPGWGHESWAEVPPGYVGAERKGFFDGVEGARKDYQNHRLPDVNNRDEYRHPPVHKEDRRPYRQGFRRGYAAGVNNLMHPGRPYPGF